MGWLFGYVIGAVLGGITIVRIIELLFGGISATAVNTVRPFFFVGTVTAITAKAGMSSFTSKVRKLQRGSAAIGDRVNSLTNSERKQD
jgi:hypothetical protein